MTLYLIDASPWADRYYTYGAWALIDYDNTGCTVEEFDGTIWEMENEVAMRHQCSIKDVYAFPITSQGVQYDTDIYSDTVETQAYNDE